MKYFLLTIIFVPTALFAQVGIGTTSPTESLDVVGNLKFSGALMPNDNPGLTNNFLKSNGSDTPTGWVEMDTTYISNFSTKVRSLINAGSGISYDSNTGVITNTASSKTNYQAVIPNPGSTNSESVTMVGLAGTITPDNGTKVMVVISGDIAQSGNDGNSTLQLYYGSGLAPSNGADVSGTAVGGNINIEFSGTGSQIKYPFTANAIISGLTPGITYWMDLGTTNSGGNTVNINNVSISAIEL